MSDAEINRRKRSSMGDWAKHGRQVECDKDGKRPWMGAMVCAGCGWLYRIVMGPDGLFTGPEECGHCKAALLDSPARPQEGTARICCEACFGRCGGAGELADLPN